MGELRGVEEGPFHLVSHRNGKHAGPFSTELDALMARTIGTFEWFDAAVLDKNLFDVYLEGK